MEIQTLNCKNCGAPLSTNKCDSCNSINIIVSYDQKIISTLKKYDFQTNTKYDLNSDNINKLIKKVLSINNSKIGVRLSSGLLLADLTGRKESEKHLADVFVDELLFIDDMLNEFNLYVIPASSNNVVLYPPSNNDFDENTIFFMTPLNNKIMLVSEEEHNKYKTNCLDSSIEYAKSQLKQSYIQLLDNYKRFRNEINIEYTSSISFEPLIMVWLSSAKPFLRFLGAIWRAVGRLFANGKWFGGIIFAILCVYPSIPGLFLLFATPIVFLPIFLIFVIPILLIKRSSIRKVAKKKMNLDLDKLESTKERAEKFLQQEAIKEKMFT